jgi:hypothetical protein
MIADNPLRRRGSGDQHLTGPAQDATVGTGSAGSGWAGSAASPRPGHHAVCPSSAVTLGTRNIDITKAEMMMPMETAKLRWHPSGCVADTNHWSPGAYQAGIEPRRPAMH